MALFRVQAVERSELLQRGAFSSTFIAPGVQACRLNMSSMHQGPKHGIGIKTAAVFTADRPVMAL